MTDAAPPSLPAVDVDAIVRASFDSAPDGLVVSSGACVLAVNDCFAALFALPPELLARRDAAALHEQVERQLRRPLRELGDSAVAATLAEVEHVDGRVFERQRAPLVAAGFEGAVVERWRDVTARHRAERELLDAQARFTALFEHAMDAMLLADDGGRYVDANPAACALFGCSRAELLARSVADLLAGPPGSFDAAWAAFLHDGRASGRVTLRRPDGRELVAHHNSVARILPGLHLAVLSDVTAQVQAELQRVEVEAQMELAMINADLVFWSIDVPTRCVTLSDPRWQERMLGYPPGRLGASSTALDELVHPDDFDRRELAWIDHLRGRAPGFEAEFRVRHADGRWLWLLSRGRAVARDAQGRTTRVVGIRIDITRRKLAEQELERQARTDGLTGLLNRRRFLELAEVEVARARRHDRPVALLMIDLDHFKDVNDRHGHAGGDTVLRSFADSARAVLRTSDVLGRVGGEEFALLLPETDRDGAIALAQRLQALVRAHPVPLASGTASYTVSIGVAAHESAGSTSVEALMLAADGALYRAKGAGRDRVLLAEPVNPQQPGPGDVQKR